MKNFFFSVVCATHNGKNKLPHLIKSIKKNSLLPKEIIICGTNNNDLSLINKKDINNLNIKFVLSKRKNQSYQREIAIKRAKYDIIFQLDDDLYVDRDYFKNMSKHFQENKNKRQVISAAILFKNFTHQAIRWNKVYYSNIVFRFILGFFNFGSKLKYMSVLESGRIIPKLPKEFLKKNKNLNENKIIDNLEWVCSTIAYNKKFYRLGYKFNSNQKKSYYEDVFFTHSLYKKGFNLCIDRDCIAYHPSTIPTNFSIFRDTIISQFYIVKYFKKSYFLFIIDIIVFSIIHLFFKSNEK